ncbi:MAG: hypothetical protein ACTSX6_02945 [Candidatus Heimdallarchaeaceae archaeon]
MKKLWKQLKSIKLFENSFLDLLLLTMLLFSTINCFILSKIWMLKLELTRIYVNIEEILTNHATFKTETTYIIGSFSTINYYSSLMIISGLLILFTFFLSRFAPRKTGVFLIIFSILGFDQFLQVFARFQYSNSAALALMLLNSFNGYKSYINPVFLILSTFTYLSTLITGLFLLTLPSTKFKKVSTKLDDVENQLSTQTEYQISKIFMILPFYGLFTIGFLGLSSFIIFILSYASSFINVVGSFIGFMLTIILSLFALHYLFSKIFEPIYPYTKFRRNSEYIVFGTFFLLSSINTIFYWLIQFDYDSILQNIIFKGFYGFKDVTKENLPSLVTFNYLVLFVIPLLVFIFILYVFKIRKKGKDSDKRKTKRMHTNFNRKKSLILSIFLIIVLGFPSNLAFQGNEILSVIHFENANVKDCFGLNGGSNRSLNIEELDLYENSSFRLTIKFEQNFDGVPEWLSFYPILFGLSGLIVDSNNDGFFDTLLNFTKLELVSRHPATDYALKKDSEGHYSINLYASSIYELKGSLDHSFFSGSEISVFLMLRSSGSYFLFLGKDAFSTIVT